MMPQDVLEGLSLDEIAERWDGIITAPELGSGVLVAETDGAILAWSSFGAARDDDAPATAELRGIYAHPESWSSGVGRALLASVEDRLRDAGHRRAYLWVLDGNERAVRFYERHQWADDGAVKIDDRRGMTLRERRHVKVLTAD